MRFLRHFATWRNLRFEKVLFASVMFVLALDVPAQNAPVITVQPASQAVLFGSNATITVAVSGVGPFRYQWQFNGMDIPGIITTVAGDGTFGFSGDGGLATNATLDFPCAVAVDASGNIFIADQDNNRVRKVDTNGIITTVAGDGPSYPDGGFSGDGGAATNAGLFAPSGITVDASGNLFIADQENNRVRKVGTNGIITTVAGNGKDATSGDGGLATNASTYYPAGVTLDSSGNLFIAALGDQGVRKVGTDGIITTVAGGHGGNFSGDGGPATNAQFSLPFAVAVDGIGNLFVADTYNYRIRKVGTNGIITTFAGDGFGFPNGGRFAGDGGAATNASLYRPEDVADDGFGTLCIADSENNRIRKIGPNGIITTVAGSGNRDYSGDGGSATSAGVSYPCGVTFDASGNLFIADTGNGCVREVIVQGPSFGITNVSFTNAGNYNVVVSSSYGSVTSSIVTLTVALPPLQAILTTDNNLGLQLNGTPGQTYILQATANLKPPINWQPIYTNAADINGNWAFTNSTVSGQSLFFRVTLP